VISPGIVVLVQHSTDSNQPPLDYPKYATEGAAGMDLLADIDFFLDPGEVTIVPTGLVMEIPSGFEGQVRPRSGLAAKMGITVLNAPGTIDSDYRGEVKVILVNHSKKQHAFHRGDRIAQVVFAPVTRAALVGSYALSDTDRGVGGLGSTGIS